MNVLNPPELYILEWLKWQVVCYVYFTTIKNYSRQNKVIWWQISLKINLAWGDEKNLRSQLWKGPVPGANPVQRPGGVGFGS